MTVSNGLEGIFVSKAEENHQEPQDSQWASRDLNRASPECKLVALPLECAYRMNSWC
jgi:hypothetical protein